LGFCIVTGFVSEHSSSILFENFFRQKLAGFRCQVLESLFNFEMTHNFCQNYDFLSQADFCCKPAFDCMKKAGVIIGLIIGVLLIIFTFIGFAMIGCSSENKRSRDMFWYGLGISTSGGISILFAKIRFRCGVIFSLALTAVNMGLLISIAIAMTSNENNEKSSALQYCFSLTGRNMLSFMQNFIMLFIESINETAFPIENKDQFIQNIHEIEQIQDEKKEDSKRNNIQQQEYKNFNVKRESMPEPYSPIVVPLRGSQKAYDVRPISTEPK